MKEGFRQSIAWLHTWAGLIFGWLLFAIFLTGTLSYFKDEISQWAQPEIAVRDVDAGTSVDIAQRWLQANAAGASRWFINLPEERAPELSVSWRNAQGQFERKTLDPQTAGPVQARDSLGGEFFYRFHFQLQMPYPWGRWLSSLAAMMMFVALISGIITHKKIFKDFFTFRPRKGQRTWLDGHNAVAVLILPFHLMITYSSLVIFMVMIMPASISARYGNDTQAFFDDLFPAFKSAPAAGRPEPLAPLRPMLDTAVQKWSGGHVETLIVNNPGDANASVALSRSDADQIVRAAGTSMAFDGVSGQLKSSSEMTASSLVLAGGLYGLHLGRFAGPWVRWLYFLCGIGGTAMIGTGLVIWLSKRRLKHAKTGVLPFELRLVEMCNIAGMSGLMLAVAGFFWANRLLPWDLPGRSNWEVNAFFSLWGLSLLHAWLRVWWRDGRTAWREQLGVAALLYCGVPVLDMLMTGEYLFASLKQGHWALIGVDLSALATGVFLAWAAFRFRTEGRQVVRQKLASTDAAVTVQETR